MFNNWISGTEIADSLKRFHADELFRRKLLSRLHVARDARVKSSWAHTDGGTSGWWDIPAVQCRWNRMITGDPVVTYSEYVARRYFQNAHNLRALSLGCGTGGKETQWARTGKFERIDAYDLSPQRIHAARNALRKTPEEGLITYEVADARRYSWALDSYDVVLFEHSLHHFSPLKLVLQKISHALKPGGYLIANEYVGPSRFQWTEDQLSAVNAVLPRIPQEYRTYYGTTYVKQRELRPSKLRMWFSDPSEAVESSKILPLLTSLFEVLELKGYGGAVLHLLFSGIAHHFATPDKTIEQFLDLAFATEDALLAKGKIDHDFALVICTNKKSGTPA